jgi:hypothetical protein
MYMLYTCIYGKYRKLTLASQDRSTFGVCGGLAGDRGLAPHAPQGKI